MWRRFSRSGLEPAHNGKDHSAAGVNHDVPLENAGESEAAALVRMFRRLRPSAGRTNVTSEMLQRVVADTILVNAALIASLLIRFIVFAVLRRNSDHAGDILVQLFNESIQAY